MTVYLVIPLPKIPHIRRIYMVLANPSDDACFVHHALVGSAIPILLVTLHTIITIKNTKYDN